MNRRTFLKIGTVAGSTLVAGRAEATEKGNPEEFVGVEDGAVPHEERLGRHEEPDGHGRNGSEPLPGEQHEQPDQQARGDGNSDLCALESCPRSCERLIGHGAELLGCSVEEPGDRPDDHGGYPRQGGHLVAPRRSHAGQVERGERVRVADRTTHPDQLVVGEVVARGQQPRDERADGEENGRNLGVQHPACGFGVGHRLACDVLHEPILPPMAWWVGVERGDG